MALLSFDLVCSADEHVAIVARATPEYHAAKFASSPPRRESYVFMSGRKFDGATVDRTFDRTTVRDIANFLAPKLTAQNYWPVRELKDADLVLVVHWGVTTPNVSFAEAAGQTTIQLESSATQPATATDSSSEAGSTATYQPGIFEGVEAVERNDLADRMETLNSFTESANSSFGGANSARLLGYAESLRKFSQSFVSSADEYTLRSDLRMERYFIIVRAYNLRAGTAEARQRPVWTLHANVSSPGNNFTSALGLMSSAASDHFGQTTDGVKSIVPTLKEGRVELGDLIVLGEAK